MEYRKVTPEERLYIHRMQSLAFNFSLNESEIREQIKKGEYSVDTTYGAIDDTGKILAGLEAIPYTMWFDGNKVPMTGIGGVVSAPEARRGGNIRELFRKIFNDSYESGSVFSHLFPFSHEYYRKFGYEHVGAATKYKLPVDPARMLKQTGKTHEFIADTASPETVQKMKDVYEAFASKHNVMVSRSEDAWKDALKITFLGGDRLYYWTDSSSELKAWARFEKSNDTLTIKDIVWADHDAMLGMLQFFGMYEGAVKEMTLTTSPEFVPELYWPNLYSISAEKTNWIGMNRIINVRRALEMMKKPVKPGNFIIKVNDDFASWNNDTYLVEYDNESCSVTATDKEPDIELSQRALTQLILGVYEPTAALRGKEVSFNCDTAKLCELFPKKNILIRDFF